MLDFVIAGFPKCGSTSINDMLAQNPMLDICSRKESHFYAHKELLKFSSGPGDERLQRNIIRCREDYEKHFKNNGTLKGESSVFYAFVEQSIERIATENSDVKVILITRKPSERILSNYKYLFQRKREVFNFTEALNSETQRKQLNYEPIWYYRSLSDYEVYIQNILKYIKEENLKLIDYDDFFGNAVANMKDIETFLNVDSFPDYTEKWSKNSRVPKSDLVSFFVDSGLGRVLSEKQKGFLKKILYAPVKIDVSDVCLELENNQYLELKMKYEKYYNN